MDQYLAKGRPPYSLRLGSMERRELTRAAAQRGVALSTYIRERALEAARQDLAPSDEG